MKKFGKFVILTLTAALLLSLAACGSSFEYDEDTADRRAREVTDVLVTQDYDAIVGLFREDLQSLTTAEAFKDAWDPYLKDAGAFVEIRSIRTAGQTDKAGDQYIVAAVSCKYENAKRTYTIVFDTDFNVAGLYLK
jgi:hypothetical protein